MTTITDKPDDQPKPTRATRPRILAVVGLIAFVIMGVALVGRLLPPDYQGQVIDPDLPVTNFTLIGPGGAEVDLIDFRGKAVIIYYGYTYCPDVCPATMNELRVAMESLGKKADDVQVLMVTLDPERDTPQVLADYLAHFHPDFVGLTGTEDAIEAASAPLGIFYEREAGTASTGYLINHTATTMALDRQGRLRLLYPFDTAGEVIAADLRHLLRE